jgi:hypothetical protein
MSGARDRGHPQPGVLRAIGIGWDGRRSILAVELASRESRSSWRDFRLGLHDPGFTGVEFVVSDDHAGLRQAIVEVLSESRLAALLRALPAQRPRLRPGQGRRRLPARAEVALRPARLRRRQAARSGCLVGQAALSAATPGRASFAANGLSVSGGRLERSDHGLAVFKR